MISRIREHAFSLGFDLFGISDTNVFSEEIGFFKKWLSNGFAGDMEAWLENGIAKRGDPRLLLPETKSIICLGMNYFNGDHVSKDNLIARYAWSQDYHDLMGDKLSGLSEFISSLGYETKWYVDTGAIFERYFAAKAGLGFIGRNTCLITKEFGSWVFLGIILTTLELAPTPAIKSPGCGSCRKCIDACPGKALSDKQIDCRKCVSYLTIEKRGNFTPEETNIIKGQKFCFGCDICQEVCPHNIRVKKTKKFPVRFNSLSIADIGVNEEEFNVKFEGSPLRRAKYNGLARNLSCD